MAASPQPKGGKWPRFKHWYRRRKRYSIPLTILVLLGLLLLIPQTRYPLAGTIYKKDFRLIVLDAATNSPISGATVSSGSFSTETDGTGQASLRLSVGNHQLSITKTYYADQTVSYTVPLLSQKTIPSVAFTATGRQVNITVTNTFTRQPLAGVNIKFADSEAVTDEQGSAVGVVPEATKTEEVTLSLDGYNNAKVEVLASASEIKQNDFRLTPAGKLYFLSKLSGTIDLVKSDLDGKHRKTVWGGTGREEDSNTVLLASRDWKYLTLLSRRTDGNPKLYLIETDSDEISTIDEGGGTFTPIGWDDYNFIYQVDRYQLKDYKPRQQSIKSFNATTKQSITLDNTQAVGSSSSTYARERYDYYYGGRNNFYIIDHNLIYSKSWDWGYNDASAALVESKTNSIHKINVNGSGHQTLLTFSIDKYLDSFLYQPQTVYYQLQGSKTKYYVYASGVLSQSDTIKAAYEQYQDTYITNTYLLSPDGDQVFWFEERDGKNNLLLGDINAGSEQTVGRSSDFTPYGWYSDDYLLAAKDSSELYIFPVSGLSDEIKAYKVTDYHKPSRSFYGYGGGYGGL